MYKNKKILGVITAKGQSNGIPKKNIKILAGEPLIVYTIKAAKKSKYLTRCILSSEDEEIIKICKEHNVDIPFVRPIELAMDDSIHMEVIQHAINSLKEKDNQEYDYVMILQPTSPLRIAYDIDECIKKIVDGNADSVMSMVELTDFSLKKLKKIKNDFVLPLIEKEGKQSNRRQDLGKVYKRNCVIYLTKTDLIMKKDLFGKKSLAYIMPQERSIDINTLHDFELAEFLLKNKKNDL